MKQLPAFNCFAKCRFDCFVCWYLCMFKTLSQTMFRTIQVVNNLFCPVKIIFTSAFLVTFHRFSINTVNGVCDSDKCVRFHWKKKKNQNQIVHLSGKKIRKRFYRDKLPLCSTFDQIWYKFGCNCFDAKQLKWFNHNTQKWLSPGVNAFFIHRISLLNKKKKPAKFYRNAIKSNQLFLLQQLKHF